MTPIQHASNNAVLAPPQGATSEECRPLAITRVQYTNGAIGVVSFWRPSAEELQRLNAGKAVMISAWGSTHPPIAVLVEGDAELPL